MQTGVPFTAVDCCPAGQIKTVAALAAGEIQVATAIARVAAMSGNARITACLSMSVCSSLASQRTLKTGTEG